jgi:cytochrome c oxidase subunit 4
VSTMNEQEKHFKHPSFYPGDAPETEHPFSLYISVWILLFVLSGFSYMVDYINVEGYLRWFLVTVFAFLKAGLVVGVFMHMAWERMAFLYAITLPPLFLLALAGILAVDGAFVYYIRDLFMSLTPS